METVIGTMISGLCGIVSALIVAAKTSNNLSQKLEIQQAVQNERVESYQRTTNEKIDRLTEQVNAQAVYGTKIALMDERQRRTDELVTQLQAQVRELREARA